MLDLLSEIDRILRPEVPILNVGWLLCIHIPTIFQIIRWLMFYLTKAIILQFLEIDKLTVIFGTGMGVNP